MKQPNITGEELARAEEFVAEFNPDERVFEYPFSNLRAAVESHSNVVPAIFIKAQELVRQAQGPDEINETIFNVCCGLYEAGIIIGIQIAERRTAALAARTERPQ